MFPFSSQEFSRVGFHSKPLALADQGECRRSRRMYPLVGPDDAVLAKSSSLWSVRDFRWRDAGLRTREKLPRHPFPRIPTPSPASPCAHRPHCAVARLQLLEIPTLLDIYTTNQELGHSIQRRVRFLWCSLGLCAQATTGR